MGLTNGSRLLAPGLGMAETRVSSFTIAGFTAPVASFAGSDFAFAVSAFFSPEVALPATCAEGTFFAGSAATLAGAGVAGFCPCEGVAAFAVVAAGFAGVAEAVGLGVAAVVVAGLLAAVCSGLAGALLAGFAAVVLVAAGAGACFVVDVADAATGFVFDCDEGLLAGCAVVCAHSALERTTIIELCISFIENPCYFLAAGAAGFVGVESLVK